MIKADDCNPMSSETCKYNCNHDESSLYKKNTDFVIICLYSIFKLIITLDEEIIYYYDFIKLILFKHLHFEQKESKNMDYSPKKEYLPRNQKETKTSKRFLAQSNLVR